jgi:zinc/manganese transport system substrate-binding protein
LLGAGMTALALAALALAAMPARAQPAKPIPVVASFSILADFAKAVGKERVSVTALVGANADAHVYQAKPADAKAVKEASLVLVNGLGFDGFMTRLARSSATKAVIVTATTGIKPIEQKEAAGHGHGHSHGHSHGKVDPHAWQSIEAAKIYVANIRDGLIKADPAGKEDYAKNADSYLAELTALKVEIEKDITAIPVEKRVIITNHDSLAYFGREFGFTLAAVQGVSTEGEPSAKDVARIIRAAKEKKARAVFVENMASPRIAEQIGRETGAKIGGTLFSDALSDEKGPAPTYIAMMRHNAKMLVAALKD